MTAKAAMIILDINWSHANRHTSTHQWRVFIKNINVQIQRVDSHHLRTVDGSASGNSSVPEPIDGRPEAITYLS